MRLNSLLARPKHSEHSIRRSTVGLNGFLHRAHGRIGAKLEALRAQLSAPSDAALEGQE